MGRDEDGGRDHGIAYPPLHVIARLTAARIPSHTFAAGYENGL